MSVPKEIKACVCLLGWMILYKTGTKVDLNYRLQCVSAYMYIYVQCAELVVQHSKFSYGLVNGHASVCSLYMWVHILCSFQWSPQHESLRRVDISVAGGEQVFLWQRQNLLQKIERWTVWCIWMPEEMGEKGVLLYRVTGNEYGAAETRHYS